MLILFSFFFFVILNSFFFNELSFFFILWFIICTPLFLVQVEKKIVADSTKIDNKVLQTMVSFSIAKLKFHLATIQNKLSRIVLSNSYFAIQTLILFTVSAINDFQTKKQILNYLQFIKITWTSTLKIKNVS